LILGLLRWAAAWFDGGDAEIGGGSSGFDPESLRRPVRGATNTELSRRLKLRRDRIGPWIVRGYICCPEVKAPNPFDKNL
jgi:hypothetical protein